MKSVLAIIFVFICLNSLGQTRSGHTIKGAGYKISFPATWKADSSKNMGTALIFYAPPVEKNDNFRENVNLLIQDLRGQNIDIKKYKEITDQQLKELGGDSKLYESVLLKKNNTTIYRIVYEMTQNNRLLRFTALCHLRNEKAYLLTFTSRPAQYERFKNDGESILNSFELTK